MHDSLKNLVRWSDASTIALINDKTKAMLTTTTQMASYHSLRKEGIRNVCLKEKRNIVCIYNLLTLAQLPGPANIWIPFPNLSI